MPDETYSAAAPIVPASTAAKLMYSRPVADSIERVSDVRQAIHTRTIGNAIVTSSRSATSSTGPVVSDSNGAWPGPPPSVVQTTKSSAWTIRTASRSLALEDQRPFRDLGRRQVPVAEHDRGQRSAADEAEHRELDEQRDGVSGRGRPVERGVAQDGEADQGADDSDHQRLTLVCHAPGVDAGQNDEDDGQQRAPVGGRDRRRC